MDSSSLAPLYSKRFPSCCTRSFRISSGLTLRIAAAPIDNLLSCRSSNRCSIVSVHSNLTTCTCRSCPILRVINDAHSAGHSCPVLQMANTAHQDQASCYSAVLRRVPGYQVSNLSVCDTLGWISCTQSIIGLDVHGILCHLGNCGTCQGGFTADVYASLISFLQVLCPNPTEPNGNF